MTNISYKRILFKQVKVNMKYGYFTQFRKYKATLKLVNCTKVLSETKNVEKPLKVPLLKRWGIYWKSLYTDYKEAILDTVKDCKEHPIKASIYVSLLASCAYLHQHNPNECSFKVHLLQNTNKIMQVGEAIRNPVSEHYVKWLGQCYSEGIVRQLNLGIISLIWLDDYDKMCSLYKAICPYLKVRYVTFYQRVIDVGFLDKWWILDSKMKDYDINEAEFSNVNYEYK